MGGLKRSWNELKQVGMSWAKLRQVGTNLDKLGQVRANWDELGQDEQSSWTELSQAAKPS